MKALADNVRGVPLKDIAAWLERAGIPAERENDGLRVEGRYGTTEVRVRAPAEPSFDGHRIKAVVVVRTRLSGALPVADARVRDLFNHRAALGALTSLNGEPWVVSRLTVHEGDDAWQLHVPLIGYAAARAADALFREDCPLLVPDGGRKGEADWPRGTDFVLLAKHVQKLCFCSWDSDGFTAEFPLRKGAGMSALGDDNTALFCLRSQAIHPALGPGLHVMLAMPHQIRDAAGLDSAVAKLNAWEAFAGDRVPHYGGWSRGQVNNPAYTAFIPEGLWENGLVSRLATWMRMRALLADGFLLSHGIAAKLAA